MLNVALGGTMVQDLSLVEAWRSHPSDPTGRLWRRFQEATMADLPVPDHPRHPIALAPGSRLHDLLGDEVTVDSFHHQAVDAVAPGLVASARAADGVIEAVEMPGSFVLGMQCELHEEWRVEPRVQGVVEAFVAAAASALGLDRASGARRAWAARITARSPGGEGRARLAEREGGERAPRPCRRGPRR